MTRDGSLAFMVFTLFRGEGEGDPFQTSKYVTFFFLTQHKPLVECEVYNLGSKNKSDFLLNYDDLPIHLMAKDLMYP